MTIIFVDISKLRAMLAKLHARLGDFWWYSLMMFLACRAADVLNAFVGLWLVPKYVDPSELGAVKPLTDFAAFLAVPIAVFANTFRNEMTLLATNREFGRLKSLMQGVFVSVAIFIVLALATAKWTFPLFLERIRIPAGSLAMLVIASSFLGAISPIYNNALQALKKFKTSTIINLAGAPLRILVMLVAMPFRALSGYFLGQCAPSAFTIGACIFGLKKELSVPAKPYWNRETIRRFTGTLAIFALWALTGGTCTLIESLVLRQRLPDLDSAGYYMATRFSDISTYLYMTLAFAMFPFSAEIAKKGGDIRPLVLKATAASFAFCAVTATTFLLIGKPILALLPHGTQYAEYWWAIPCLIGISAIGTLPGLYTTAEISAGRFGFLKWLMPIEIIYPSLLLVVTGYGYFKALMPADWIEFLHFHNIYALDTMLWWMTAGQLARLVCCCIAMRKKRQ